MKNFAKILTLSAVLAFVACDSTTPTAPASGDLEVVPNPAVMTAGKTRQFTVTGPGGTTITDGVTWQSSAPHIISISSSGLAMGMYEHGNVTIQASVGTASASGSANVPAACNAPAELQGTPPSQPETSQLFEVQFESGVDVASRTAELAQQIGFLVTETTATGFLASLSPQQTNTLRCVEDIALLIYS